MKTSAEYSLIWLCFSSFHRNRRHVDQSRAHFSLSTDAALWVMVLRLPHLRRLKISPTHRMTEIGVQAVLKFASSMNEAHSEPQRLALAHAAAASGFPVWSSIVPLIAQRGVLASLVHLELNMAPAARLTGLTSLQTLILQPPVPVSFNTYKTIRRIPLRISDLHLPPSLTELRIVDCYLPRLHRIVQQCPRLRILDLSESQIVLSKELIELSELETLIINRLEEGSATATKVPLPASIKSVQAIGFFQQRFALDFSRCSSLT
jgi:hypothetical protein